MKKQHTYHDSLMEHKHKHDPKKRGTRSGSDGPVKYMNMNRKEVEQEQGRERGQGRAKPRVKSGAGMTKWYSDWYRVCSDSHRDKLSKNRIIGTLRKETVPRMEL
jgi:hypothetical protein